jgi:hypothetical protein
MRADGAPGAAFRPAARGPGTSRPTPDGLDGRAVLTEPELRTWTSTVRSRQEVRAPPDGEASRLHTTPGCSAATGRTLAGAGRGDALRRRRRGGAGRPGGRRRPWAGRHGEPRVGATQDGLHAGHQLARVEWLREVVVGADLEAYDAVDVLAACREHEDGGLAPAPDLAGHLHAVAPRQHEVEHDEVGSTRSCCAASVPSWPDGSRLLR